MSARRLLERLRNRPAIVDSVYDLFQSLRNTSRHLSQPRKVRGKKAPRALAAGGTEMPFPAAETPGAPAAPLAGVSVSPRGASGDQHISSRRLRRPAPKLKGSIGEGSNHSNFSDQTSVRILGQNSWSEFLVRDRQNSWNPKKTTKSTVAKKTTSTKRHATRNTRRGRRKGEKRKTNCTEEARRTTHSHRSKRYYTSRQKMLCLKSKIDQNRICLPSIYERSAFRAVKIRIECQD